MEVLTIAAVGVGLAMDAFAVSIVTAAAYAQLRVRHALRMAGFFGSFQAIMPLVGYLAGLTLKNFIAAYDHWVAFGLLAGVGAKMIYESFKFSPDRQAYDPTRLGIVFALAVATSIDALAVGVTISLLTDAILAAVVIIGVITFVLSCVGFYVGKYFGHFFESKIEIIGGVILIGIGLKILLQHLLATGT